MKPVIQIKRVYEDPERSDGKRVLVDRLWPRGLSREDLVMDDWQKQLAPTAELRKWFAHIPARWSAFQKKYKAELAGNEAVSAFVEKYRKTGKITLLYAGKDPDRNNALILRNHLLQIF